MLDLHTLTATWRKVQSCLGILGTILLGLVSVRGDDVIGPWEPLFRGIEHATAVRVPEGINQVRQVVNVLRIDLTDPDIRFLATPPIANYERGARETAAATVSQFTEQNHVQVAVNANLFRSVAGDNNAMIIQGMTISEGSLVSDPYPVAYKSSVYIATNNHVSFYPANWPMAATNGIFTAVTGSYPLVTKGVNIADDGVIAGRGLNPRTAIGATKDGRYFLMMTIDGRQPDWSDGALLSETAAWMLKFGAFNAVNLDGGGSTTMSMEYCPGHAVRLNRPSYLLSPDGAERLIGSHLGVFAKPLPSIITNVTTDSRSGKAIVRWQTLTPATTQVEYGVTTNYGAVTPLNLTPSTDHLITLSGFNPDRTLYFRMISTAAGQTDSKVWCLSPDSAQPVAPRELFGVDKSWKYELASLDGMDWMKTGYDDSHWPGEGPGLLHIEDNVHVAPRNTLLPKPAGSAFPATTYYFRTTFTNPLTALPILLVFSNFVDDGAVFYLNGKEIQRIRMREAPVPIYSTNFATDFPCSTGEAVTNCPTVFTLFGDAVTNIVRGLNVLAVEVHNYNAKSPDIVFGSALTAWPSDADIPPPPSKLHLSYNAGSGKLIVAWVGGEKFVLQWSSELGATEAWTSVPDGASSPVEVEVQVQNATRYFRLSSQ